MIKEREAMSKFYVLNFAANRVRVQLRFLTVNYIGINSTVEQNAGGFPLGSLPVCRLGERARDRLTLLRGLLGVLLGV